jgi:hypothetical protein
MLLVARFMTSLQEAIEGEGLSTADNSVRPESIPPVIIPYEYSSRRTEYNYSDTDQAEGKQEEGPIFRRRRRSMRSPPSTVV